MSIGNNFFGANLAFNGAAGFMALNEQRLTLANQVSEYVIKNGELTPAQTVAVAQVDKVLTLRTEKAKIDYEVGIEMEKARSTMRRKERELKEKLLADGAIFV